MEEALSSRNVISDIFDHFSQRYNRIVEGIEMDGPCWDSMAWFLKGLGTHSGTSASRPQFVTQFNFKALLDRSVSWCHLGPNIRQTRAYVAMGLSCSVVIFNLQLIFF